MPTPARQGQETTPLKRVMVVDDNEILLRAWKRLLEKQPCRFDLTADPHQALDLMGKNKVDLLIADIVMPEMDGFELIHEARKMDPNLRIILTTGYVFDFSRLKPAIDSSDLHILLKPYNDIHDVQKFVERVLNNDRTLDQENVTTRLGAVNVHVWNL